MNPEANGFTIQRAAMLVLFVAAILGLVTWLPMLLKPLGLPPLMATVIGQLVLLSTTVLFALVEGERFAGMGLRERWEGKDVLLSFGMLTLHYAGSIALALFLMLTDKLDLLGGDQPAGQTSAADLLTEFTNLPPLTFLGLAVLLALLAGVGEELLFRGYLFTRLKRLGLPGWAVIGITALSFGLLHVNGYGLVASLSKALWFGVPTGIYFWYRRRLGPLMLVHFLVDFIGFSLLYVALKLLPYLPIPS